MPFCPSAAPICLPVAVSHSRAVSSASSRQSNFSIGADGHEIDGVLMLKWRPDGLARGGVPQPCRVVLASGQRDLAVGADSYCLDIVLMLERCTDLFARGRVPLPRRVLPCSRQNNSAIGADGQWRGDLKSWAKRRSGRLARRREPHLGRGVSLAITANLPSALMAMAMTNPCGLSGGSICVAVAVSHSWAIFSLPVSAVLPSALSVAATTKSGCCSGSPIGLPVVPSHRWTALKAIVRATLPSALDRHAFDIAWMLQWWPKHLAGFCIP